MNNNHITRRTEKSYMAKARAAINYSAAKRENAKCYPIKLTFCDIVDDLIQREDIRNSTRNALRSALLWSFRNSIFSSVLSDQMKAISKLEEMEIVKDKRIQGKTIPVHDLNRILSDLVARSKRSKWAKKCFYWIQSGLASGARPIEWLDAEWANSEKCQLKIKNAKTKISEPAFSRVQSKLKESSGNKFGNNISIESFGDRGHFRFVPIIVEQDRKSIDLHLDGINQFLEASFSQADREKRFQNYYDACRLELSRSCKIIWNGERMYSFYSLRRQFAANVKAVVGSEEAARLMGHSRVDSPAAGHYGKMNQAHPKFKSMRQEQRQSEQSSRERRSSSFRER